MNFERCRRGLVPILDAYGEPQVAAKWKHLKSGCLFVPHFVVGWGSRVDRSTSAAPHRFQIKNGSPKSGDSFMITNGCKLRDMQSE